MEFKKVGDWKRVERLIGRIDNEMRKAQMLSLKRFGLKAEAIAKTHISRQDLNWQELTPEYLEKKVREGKSENILVATSSYFQSITTYVLVDTVYSGVTRKAINKDGKIIADIAKVHEYGSKSGGIPARPLWKPTLQEVMLWHAKVNTPEMYFMKAIKKY